MVAVASWRSNQDVLHVGIGHTIASSALVLLSGGEEKRTAALLVGLESCPTST